MCRNLSGMKSVEFYRKLSLWLDISGSREYCGSSASFMGLKTVSSRMIVPPDLAVHAPWADGQERTDLHVEEILLAYRRAAALSAAALVALVGASIAPAASHKASAGTMRIWIGRRPQGRDQQGRERLGGQERRQRPGRAERVRRHPEPARHSQARGRTGRHRRRARLDGPAGRQRPRHPARPEGVGAQGQSPEYAPQGVHLREALRHARRARKRGPLRQHELAKVPKSWRDLEKKALAFQKKGDGRVGLAVQQGSGGDAYHMYPFFSGLCGYIFGTSTNGRLNPNKVGVDNDLFLKNSTHDQQVEQGRPDQLEDQRRYRDAALH